MSYAPPPASGPAPFDFGGIIASVVKLPFVTFPKLLLLYGGALVVVVLLQMVFTPERFMADVILASQTGDFGSLIGPIVLYLLVFLALLTWFNSIITAFLVASATGQGASLEFAVRQGTRRLFGYLGLLVILVLPAFLASIAGAVLSFLVIDLAAIWGLAILGVLIFYALKWLPAPGVLYGENQPPVAAVARASALTRGRRWALLGLAVVLGLIVVVAAFVVSLVLGLFAEVPVLPLLLGGAFQLILTTGGAAFPVVVWHSLANAGAGRNLADAFA